MALDARIGEVTERIVKRSESGRRQYLDRVAAAAERKPNRTRLSCSNLAHGFAACGPADKAALRGDTVPNIGIVTAYNDMLSAHQPYERFPELIRDAARAAGGVAEVAGGVPAMCDGVTQGQAGMELSLFSRDTIAMAAAVGLSHDMFDAAVYLGICDKIVPGLLIAALTFGHLPAVFIPAGPMPTGLPNPERSKARQLYAEKKISWDDLLDVEAKSYHAPGTCTFYGTANSNQMLMEIMGLHIPGASFVNPNTPLRDALTRLATARALAITAQGNEYTPVGRVIDERAIVNGVVGLHATGGSTNHTLHLVAAAKAAGIYLTWDDFADLSEIVPLVARVYPNGTADVNDFHKAGGMQFLIRELLADGLLHEDVTTSWGTGLSGYTQTPALGDDGGIVWTDTPVASGDETVLRQPSEPFSPEGGLRLLDGNLGRAVIKVSAVAPENQVVEAPALIFHSQEELREAFRAGELERDFVAVVRFQGPRANGMPELHQLTPTLGVLQDRGFKVALLTDGRMSGASGKVPAAIHVTPEAADGGAIAKLRNGDIVRLDAPRGRLNIMADHEEFVNREPATADLAANEYGLGRELFRMFRANAQPAELGAGVL
ncbi:phosphogluconate dehydratase [Bauldia sp.]|uniref:phosphogluconate dehydratase n=1 Tax=Bauldia sp. TaxID=2575872 RepID=UPI003BA95B87